MQIWPVLFVVCPSAWVLATDFSADQLVLKLWRPVVRCKFETLAREHSCGSIWSSACPLSAAGCCSSQTLWCRCPTRMTIWGGCCSAAPLVHHCLEERQTGYWRCNSGLTLAWSRPGSACRLAILDYGSTADSAIPPIRFDLCLGYEFFVITVAAVPSFYLVCYFSH